MKAFTTLRSLADTLREAVDSGGLPSELCLAMQQTLARVCRSLDQPPSSDEVHAALWVWFDDFDAPEPRERFASDPALAERMRRALIAARDARP